MSNATHFNFINNCDYMLKDGVVFQWNDKWITSVFKESDIVLENGFKKV